MKPLFVYTAIVGEFSDSLAPIEVPTDRRRRPVRYVCFSDRDMTCPSGWELRPATFNHVEPRRAARWHKIMSHLLFADAQFTLWHDGSHHLKVNPWDVIDDSLSGDREFATFKHPMRDCIYEETQACLQLKKDAPGRLLEQAERYSQEGYPAGEGLFETSCIARRNSAAVAGLNDLWWREIQRSSCRDQISLPYVIWKLNFAQLAVLSGNGTDSAYFTFRPHR